MGKWSLQGDFIPHNFWTICVMETFKWFVSWKNKLSIITGNQDEFENSLKSDTNKLDLGG